MIIVVDSPPGMIEAVDGGELGRAAYGDRVLTEASEHGEVFTHVALEGEHADGVIHVCRS